MSGQGCCGAQIAPTDTDMIEEKEGASSPAEGPVEGEPAPDQESAAEPTELEQAIAERDAAIEEKQQLFDRLQRAQAEFENIRKRLERERQELSEYAAMSTIESLLPILDDFERAIAADGAEPEYREGLQLIERRIRDVFERAGLSPVEEGGEFDPHLHQAVDRAPAETDDDDQKILETYQRGYRFKDRLLRPAMVKVAVKE